MRNCHCNVARVWAIPHTLLNVLITEKLCILVTLAQGGWYNYWSSSEETWWLSITTKTTSNQHRLTTSGRNSTTRHNKSNWTDKKEFVRALLQDDWLHFYYFTDLKKKYAIKYKGKNWNKLQQFVSLLCVESLWNLYWKYTYSIT